MSKHCYVVLSGPVAGQEAEYHRWYNERHLPDVLKVPGFVGAQRFKVSDPHPSQPARFLALYDIETEDPAASMADLMSRAGTPEMVLTDAMDMTSVSATLYTAITDRLLPKGSD
jgi:hypothetical protein